MPVKRSLVSASPAFAASSIALRTALPNFDERRCERVEVRAAVGNFERIGIQARAAGDGLYRSLGDAAECRDALGQLIDLPGRFDSDLVEQLVQRDE